MTITATRQFSPPTTVRDKRQHRACTRCGRVRQVNTGHPSDLCSDCVSTDPHVWRRDAWVPWDGTEGDDDDE